jgi:hypothetical protein
MPIAFKEAIAEAKQFLADSLRAFVDEATAAIMATHASSTPDNVSPLRRK